MTATTLDLRTKPGAGHSVLVLLLAAAIFINYLDRGNLATAAPLLKDELKLSNAEVGLLTSAFFWIYAPAQLIAAWLVQKINPYRALALGLAIWSTATVLTGLASGFVVLLGLRVLLGLGESAGFPASSKLLAQHLPSHRLGSANAVVCIGLQLGPAAGAFLGGMLVAHVGWRPLFLLFGGVSLLWLVPWFLTNRERSAQASREDVAAPPSYAELLSKRAFWGAAVGVFANNYVFYLVISWLPLYLVKAHGYSLAEMARLGGLVYVIAAGFGLGFGWLADRWMMAGASSNRVRKTMMSASAVVGLGCMLACGLGSPQVAILGLIAYSLSLGLSSFNNFAIGQTLAGPRAAGKWVGAQNFIGNLSGIIGPIVTGVIVDRTGRFSAAFLVAAAVLAVGLFCWSVMIRKVEPVAWRTPDLKVS